MGKRGVKYIFYLLILGPDCVFIVSRGDAEGLNYPGLTGGMRSAGTRAKQAAAHSIRDLQHKYFLAASYANIGLLGML